MNRTCLYEAHRRAGAVLVDFHGWEMPLRYGQIPEEHRKVREAAGLFDLGHMGRLEIRGRDADEWVQHLVTLDVSTIPEGGARYGLICNRDGGIIDDLIVYRLPDRLFLVVNAGNRERVLAWFEQHRADREAELIDRSKETAMIAVQGPAAEDLVPSLIESSDRDVASLPYYRIARVSLFGEPALVATTGYTGERGYEIYLDAKRGPELWQTLLDRAGDALWPIGLGARDTLRVEAGMPLYGNELTEDTNPYEAGLGAVVKLNKATDFVGRDALTSVRESGATRKLIGLRVESRRVARQGAALVQNDREVGVVTSGIPSPTLGYPVAMAYVSSDLSDPRGLEVDLQGKRIPVRPEALPFYSRTRKKAARAL